MTTRLCLIGNSHLVALQEALAARPDHWPLDCTFVPFRGTAARDTEIVNGILRPTSDEARAQMRQRTGAEEVDLTVYDAIAVVGFGLKQQHAQTVWKDARWPGLPSLERQDDLASMRPTMISRRAAEAGLSGYLQSLTGFDVAARVAAAMDCPVYVIGQPRLHARACHHPMGQFFGLSRAIKMGDAAEISDLYETASAAAAGSTGVSVLPQPRETIVDHILTDPPYMAGSARIRGEHGETERDDFKHPNAAYGALMLDQLASVVAR
ncbi:hypothetical protein [Flavimaricola marinus]|uniref:SGNH hydrolase-type esterase domain-containing protein n=1 Tax=Flavimaricola marinus TaxID=1819565 RepID=A0A238LGB3_9RHOB|nr:hypothetical protein [Flavimaricola marinus]SMY08671.1 hypothetical protein LOM8899_02826 [Flavimaricola marinus]